MKKQFLRGRTSLSSFRNLLFPTSHLSGNQGRNDDSGESVHSPETFRRTREAPFEFHFLREAALAALVGAECLEDEKRGEQLGVLARNQ
jgi:hypothetical protein